MKPYNQYELYYLAENAAQWMERGDDFAEARAIRQLIQEHKEMRNGAKATEAPSTEAQGTD